MGKLGSNMTKTIYDDTKLDFFGNGHIKEIYEKDGKVIARDIKLGFFDFSKKEKRISKERFEMLMDGKNLLE